MQAWAVAAQCRAAPQSGRRAGCFEPRLSGLCGVRTSSTVALAGAPAAGAAAGVGAGVGAAAAAATSERPAKGLAGATASSAGAPASCGAAPPPVPPPPPPASSPPPSPLPRRAARMILRRASVASSALLSGPHAPGSGHCGARAGQQALRRGAVPGRTHNGRVAPLRQPTASSPSSRSSLLSCSPGRRFPGGCSASEGREDMLTIWADVPTQTANGGDPGW